jgi:hypothetical protein
MPLFFGLRQGNSFAFHPLYLLRQEQPAARHVFERALNGWIGSLPRTASGLGRVLSIQVRTRRHGRLRRFYGKPYRFPQQRIGTTEVPAHRFDSPSPCRCLRPSQAQSAAVPEAGSGFVDFIQVTHSGRRCPAPIAGAGLPGPMLAGAGVLGWWRRRQKSA